MTMTTCTIESEELSNPEKIQSVMVTLPSGLSAQFRRRTMWDVRDETPNEGCNVSGVWLFLPDE
jgi:hypothetical protein